MSQATMTKPSSSAKSTYDPYASMDGRDASASSYQADSVPAEPQYKLVIDENVETPQYVTVTINDEFVESGAFESTVLKDGDVVEFLYFMGGGQ